jgi:hypothetical protein
VFVFRYAFKKLVVTDEATYSHNKKKDNNLSLHLYENFEPLSVCSLLPAGIIQISKRVKITEMLTVTECGLVVIDRLSW